MKRLSNKYGKNSKNNKFNKILHLEKEKVKNGFVKSANFAKIAKLTSLFLALFEKNDVYTSFFHRRIGLTQCCTQFKSPGVKIHCVLYLHYNVAFTFK